MGRRVIIGVLTLLFVLSLSLSGYGEAEDISSPSDVNQIISDFSDIDMKPGEDEDFEFELYNPYDTSMKNITLEIQIYNFRDYNENDDVDKLDNSIYFERNGETRVVYETDGLNSKTSTEVSYTVTSDEDTRKGVYSIRFSLSFNMDSTKVNMKSIGYFTDQELEQASEHIGVNDDEHFVGGYNLTRLETEGILKETSIAVKDPKPIWPQYVLGAITVTFSVLAVYFYLKESRD